MPRTFRATRFLLGVETGISCGLMRIDCDGLIAYSLMETASFRKSTPVGVSSGRGGGGQSIRGARLSNVFHGGRINASSGLQRVGNGWGVFDLILKVIRSTPIEVKARRYELALYDNVKNPPTWPKGFNFDQ